MKKEYADMINKFHDLCTRGNLAEAKNHYKKYRLDKIDRDDLLYYLDGYSHLLVFPVLEGHVDVFNWLMDTVKFTDDEIIHCSGYSILDAAFENGSEDIIIAVTSRFDFTDADFYKVKKTTAEKVEQILVNKINTLRQIQKWETAFRERENNSSSCSDEEEAEFY